MTRARPTLQHDAQLVAIDSLKPYPGNARTHDLDVIRESLRLNGQYRPLVVRSKTRHVLAGNGTLQAARAEGYSEIWATFVDVDAPTGKRINLVDNVSNDKAGWDEELLAAQLEPCLYASLPTRAANWYGPKNEVTVWEYDRAQSNDLHPTQKPIALAERAATNSTRPGDRVLDPFAGSGSTLIACENLSRRCYAMEIDPGYCDVIVDRFERHTGQSARLAPKD